MPTGAIEQPETYLQVQDAKGKRLQVPLDDRPIVIGSAGDSNLQLRSSNVLDYHAELYVDPFGQWWLRNLGAADDVLVNGQCVQRDEALESGDCITIDSFEITFVDGEVAEEVYTDPDDAPLQTQTALPKPSRRKPDASDSMSGLLMPPPLDLSHQDPAAKTQRIAPIGNMFDASLSAQPKEKAHIDTIHLSTLTEFGQRLMATPKSSERLRMLCRLMVRNDFHGQSAVGIRMVKGNSRFAPGKLCTPQSARGGAEMPHISKGLLQSILKSGTPGFAMIKTGSMKLAAVACPIRNRDKYMDMLYMTVPEEYGTQEWLSLIALAAQQYEQAEIALKLGRQLEKQNAVDQQIEAASTLQKRLIPTDPQLEGMEVAIGFRPCHLIGGDYIDAVAIDERRTLLIAADVCGKGLPAALVTSTLHTMVHAFATAQVGVQILVKTLNAHLNQYMEDIPFVSLCAIEIETQTGRAVCVNAGHPPAFIVDTDGTAQRLQEGQNTPLGIGDEPFRHQELTLKPGQMLCLYTYGVIEQANQAGVLGIGKLSEMIGTIYEEMATFEIANIRTIFNEKMDSFLKDTKPIDDRAFLFARRSGSADG